MRTVTENYFEVRYQGNIIGTVANEKLAEKLAIAKGIDFQCCEVENKSMNFQLIHSVEDIKTLIKAELVEQAEAKLSSEELAALREEYGTE